MFWKYFKKFKKSQFFCTKCALTILNNKKLKMLDQLKEYFRYIAEVQNLMNRKKV